MISLEMEDKLFRAVDDCNTRVGFLSRGLTVQFQLLRHQRCTRAVIENASLVAENYRHPALGIGMSVVHA
jgi:hypothetical protein